MPETMFDELRALFLSVPAMAFLGLVVGSFLNVVIYRLPVMVARRRIAAGAQILGDHATWQRARSAADGSAALPLAHAVTSGLRALPKLDLNTPHSHCPHCGHQIHWYENLPLASWLWLRGRCSSCRSPIALRYPVMEALTGAAFALIAWKLGPSPAALAWAGFAASMLAAGTIDLETGSVPDALTLPLLWAGLIAAVFGLTISSSGAILGAVVCYAALWAAALICERGAGHRIAGQDHFLLLAAVGAFMGWQIGVAVLVCAMVVAAFVRVASALRRGHAALAVPLGACIAYLAFSLAVLGPFRALAWPL